MSSENQLEDFDIYPYLFTLFPGDEPKVHVSRLHARLDQNGGGDFTEIQPALDAAADGDTVLVRPGEYVIVEPLDFNRLRDPERPVKNLEVRSEGGAEVTTVRMSEAPLDLTRANVVTFQNGEGEASTLEGFTLTGGTPPTTTKMAERYPTPSPTTTCASLRRHAHVGTSTIRCSYDPVRVGGKGEVCANGYRTTGSSREWCTATASMQNVNVTSPW